MQPARPLRDVFDELAGDRGAHGERAGDDLDAGPAGALADSGHGDLPDQLLSEAIVNYADTAPVEVAEHLAPFVMVHSAVPVDDAGAADLPASNGLDLLATAPEQVVSDDETDFFADDGEEDVDLPEPAPAPGELSYADALDFGFGSGAGDEPADAAPSIEDTGGVPFEPGPADELPQPVETAAEPTFPWVAPPEPEVEGGDGPEDIDTSG